MRATATAALSIISSLVSTSILAPTALASIAASIVVVIVVISISIPPFAPAALATMFASGARERFGASCASSRCNEILADTAATAADLGAGLGAMMADQFGDSNASKSTLGQVASVGAHILGDLFPHVDHIIIAAVAAGRRLAASAAHGFGAGTGTALLDFFDLSLVVVIFLLWRRGTACDGQFVFIDLGAAYDLVSLFTRRRRSGRVVLGSLGVAVQLHLRLCATRPLDKISLSLEAIFTFYGARRWRWRRAAPLYPLSANNASLGASSVRGVCFVDAHALVALRPFRFSRDAIGLDFGIPTRTTLADGGALLPCATTTTATSSSDGHDCAALK
jgi:hypothetical protein